MAVIFDKHSLKFRVKQNKQESKESSDRAERRKRERELIEFGNSYHIKDKFWWNSLKNVERKDIHREYNWQMRMRSYDHRHRPTVIMLPNMIKLFSGKK